MSLEKSRLPRSGASIPHVSQCCYGCGTDRLISPEVESSHDSPPSSPPPALLSPITLEPTTQCCVWQGNLQRAIRRIIHAERSLKREVELLDATLCEEIEVRVEQAIRTVLIEIMAAEEEMLVPSANLMSPDEDVDMVDCDDAGEVGKEVRRLNTRSLII
ncbi:hypothetical protein HD554DRAFT_2036985 [Boletus coccyginus]|nr:hypothetical protein HD554DRAFT_2036985 [Boletus coccyginus]